MKKATLIGLIGLTLTVLPFIGIPDTWKIYITSGSGVLLLVLGYLFVRDYVHAESYLGNGERGNDSYVETTEPLFK